MRNDALVKMELLDQKHGIVTTEFFISCVTAAVTFFLLFAYEQSSVKMSPDC